MAWHIIGPRTYVPGQRLSEHFSEQEFRCPHCNQIKVVMELIIRLERLRRLMGNRPIYVLSGYRCPVYNARIGGAPRSYHMCGMAADIRSPGRSVQYMANAARLTGFGGVGKYYRSGFVHVDVGPRRTWTGN